MVEVPLNGSNWHVLYVNRVAMCLGTAASWEGSWSTEFLVNQNSFFSLYLYWVIVNLTNLENDGCLNHPNVIDIAIWTCVIRK